MLRKSLGAVEAIVGLVILILSVCILVKESILVKPLGDFLILVGFLVMTIIYGLEFRYWSEGIDEGERGKERRKER